jgi:predicted RecB family nuclease
MKYENGQYLFSPSDLASHLACSHLTELESRYSRGEIELQYHSSAMLDLLIELGKRHEQDYLTHLTDSGKSIVSMVDPLGPTSTVLEAMQSGVDVIFQASLKELPWRGRADFLLRVEVPSQLGAWSYEVADTKLAVETRATTVLQLCMYSEMVGALQGLAPKFMHVVKPGTPFESESLRIADYAAYYRFAKRRFLQHVANFGEKESYPEPCSHCEICNWWPKCDKRWRDDDHLTFVAGMPKSQIVELDEFGIRTLEAFANSPSAHPSRPQRGSIESFEKSQRQAKIQLKGRIARKPEYEFNSVEQDKGFFLLPVPDAGDVFFDIEGNPRAGDEGLEYLFGIVTVDELSPAYLGNWSLNPRDEKIQFQRFVDDMIERWQRFPTMHIYHFAPYEPSALKRLALRHATREDELDRLLRSERFVDLYAVTRQAIRASVESYSIKQLEQFYGFQRIEELESARTSLREVERLIELGLTHELTAQHREVVELYNKDDCLSTLALRNWLELLRAELTTTGIDINRPPEKSGDPTDNQILQSIEVQVVFDALTVGIEDEPKGDAEKARWLLAHTLDYFRREAKCTWWEYFRLQELDYDQLMTERVAIAGLQFVEEFPPERRSTIPVHRYCFPDQETTISAGDKLYDGAEKSWGTAVAIDVEAHWIDVKKTKESIARHPSAIYAFNFVNAKPIPEALLSFGQELVIQTRQGIQMHDARYDLLTKAPPRLKSLNLPLPGSVEEVAISLAMDLDNSVLPIQGPPGAGKTHVGSRMIAALVNAGKRVGVTAVSHKVILNLLDTAVANAKDGEIVRAAHQIGSSEVDDYPSTVTQSANKDESAEFLRKGYVVGGTAWLWSSDQMAGQLDYLFIDEAGQMSLAVALAAGRAAKNIVLLGDPQQLEQPQQGSHPEGAGVAALTHLLDGKNTIPEENGLFLPSTWRLHPKICQFTSEVYYDNRLHSEVGLEQQVVDGPCFPKNYGLLFLPVEHVGNQNRCLEETEAITKLVSQIVETPHYWTDKKGIRKRLEANDILVVAPFNAQVQALRQSVPNGTSVGTVDKFQGQEAPVVIYSMTCSSAADAPRGMVFLYSPNRMNVASSRAKCLSIIVASPDLLEPACGSPDHIRLVNGLCRFAELAAES